MDGSRNGEAMEGIFVTGTDTQVGKTTVSAGLLKLLHGSRKVSYWKPIQTGTVIGDDTQDVKLLTALEADVFLEPKYRFAEPIAPYLAAKQWGRSIDLGTIVEAFNQYKAEGRFILVEGAGGFLVPLTEKELQNELVKKLKLPVILVSPNKLGTINNTLLTVNALRADGIDVLGVILTKSRQAAGKGNAECIARYGGVSVLAEFDETSDRKTTVGQVSCHPDLRKLFNVSAIPG